MQYFSTLFDPWFPLVSSHNLRPPCCSFFNIYDYNHYDYTQCISRKMQRTTTRLLLCTTKMHFITFNFKRQLNSMNIFDATFDLQPYFQLCLTVLKKISKSQIRQLWVWFTHSSLEPREWHFIKNITCSWIIPKITKLVLYCNSSRMLAITREVENGFRTSSWYFSSEKCCWN